MNKEYALPLEHAKGMNVVEAIERLRQMRRLLQTKNVVYHFWIFISPECNGIRKVLCITDNSLLTMDYTCADGDWTNIRNIYMEVLFHDYSADLIKEGIVSLLETFLFILKEQEERLGSQSEDTQNDIRALKEILSLLE